jgi:S-adenosylmethionine decarboxylase
LLCVESDRYPDRVDKTAPVTGPMRDLAPEILRQRLVVEGRCRAPIDATKIASYLSGLSDVCGMKRLIDPVTHRSDRYGWAGWVHWEASGAHMYAWEQPRLFFSVDIYACRAFDVDAVCRYTAEFLGADEVVAKSF